MGTSDVIVVGGGIAGLSTAWHLARAGQRVTVLEREWACGTQATGTNAAIFRHFDFDEAAVRLAVRSRELLGALGDFLTPTGALYLAPEERLRAASPALSQVGVPHAYFSAEEVSRRWPVVTAGLPAVHVPVDGVVDVGGLVEALQKALRAAGGTVRTSAQVVAIVREAAGFKLQLASGETLEAPRLVLAGGAWSAELAKLLGLSMPVEPRRRHLVVLEPHVQLAATHPVVWRLSGDEVYFRPESGGVLASPCDEVAWPAGVVPTSSEHLARLGELLPTLAASMADARVRRAWAGLRSFAPDREFVVGSDARAPGLTWIAGLGGRGVTCGLGLGEVCASAVLERIHPLLEAFTPARILCSTQ